jgi:hypothetical protein
MEMVHTVDVMGIFMCESFCLSALFFFSASKLHFRRLSLFLLVRVVVQLNE